MDDSQEVIKSVKVANASGIHARPAAMIAKVANLDKETEVFVTLGEEVKNAKSVMHLMMLGASCGDVLELRACGPSAVEVIDALVDVFSRKFHEE